MNSDAANSDAAYRRAVEIDRIMCLLHGHDELERAPFDYKEAASWFLAEAQLHVDELQLPRVRGIIVRLTEATDEIRAACLSASALLGVTAGTMSTMTLIDRMTDARITLDEVTRAFCGWPGFWPGAAEEESESESEPYGPEDEGGCAP